MKQEPHSPRHTESRAKVPFIPPSFPCLRPDYGFRLEAALRNLGQASQESQFPRT